MPLPPNFNEWEHLQDSIRLQHNKLVRQYFKNQADDDISTPKASLKHACVLKDSDTVAMTQLRLWLFEITCGHAQSLQAPIYGIPVTEHQRNITFLPQVRLYFKERINPTATQRVNPVPGEITFRLVGETSASMTRTKAEVLARAIKQEFASPIFVWEKGHYCYYYRDFEHGYDLRLNVTSKQEGERVTRAVLGIQNHTFNDDYSDYTTNTRTYSETPGKMTVYGSQVDKPIKRPRADVRFRYAQMALHGRLKIINLVATPESALKQVIERVNQA